MTMKRRIANAVGRLLNVEIVPSGTVQLLFEKQHLKRLLEEFHVDCVFDVGANDGQYGGMLREIGYRGHIISFEPVPFVAASLSKKAARDSKWSVEQIALDDSERQTTFNVMSGSQFSSLKLPSDSDTDRFAEQNCVVQAIDVRTARLASFFESYQTRLQFSRPFLKMDTQGNDLAVARGAGAYLSKFVGLQSELAVKRIYAGSEDYRTALDYYAASGFELSALVPNNLGHFPELIEIDCIMFNREVVMA